MKSIPPMPWKPLLTFLYLAASMAGIVRFFGHRWAWGADWLVLSYALFRLREWLWPPTGD